MSIPPFIRIGVIIHTATTYADRVFPDVVVLIVLWRIRPTNMSDVTNPLTFVCYNYFSAFPLQHPRHPGRRPMPRKIDQKFTIYNEKESTCSLPKNIKVSIIKHLKKKHFVIDTMCLWLGPSCLNFTCRVTYKNTENRFTYNALA